MKILNSILFGRKSNVQFWLSLCSLGIGLLASLLAVILYFDISNAESSNNDLFGENSLVIQKKVTQFSSFGLNSTEFTDEEINLLKQKSGIIDIGKFTSANYEVGISENAGDGLPGFYANMFLQSVPDRFIIDIDSLNWSWNKNSAYVPIILPRSFLVLVNYGIAPSQGLPQISEDFIKSVRIKLHLIGHQEKGTALGKVVGFSSEINSILVPESFVIYSNKKYAPNVSDQINRLFLKFDDGAFSQIQGTMEDMNLDISESTLGLSKLKSLINQILGFVLIIALLIMLVSILSLLQFFQIIIINSSAEVKTLLKIGYGPEGIVKLVLLKFSRIILNVGLICLMASYSLKYLIFDKILFDLGILTNGISLTYGTGFVILLIILFIFVVRMAFRKTVQGLSKD